MQENMAADSKYSTTVYNIEAKNSNVIIGDGTVFNTCPKKGTDSFYQAMMLENIAHSFDLWQFNTSLQKLT